MNKKNTIKAWLILALIILVGSFVLATNDPFLIFLMFFLFVIFVFIDIKNCDKNGKE